MIFPYLSNMNNNTQQKWSSWKIVREDRFTAILKSGNKKIKITYGAPMWTAIWFEDDVQLSPWEGGKFPALLGNYDANGRLTRGRAPIEQALEKFLG